jgi:hypothetical protein
VVFIREIAPRRAVAMIANRLYNENYLTRPMRSLIATARPELSVGDRIEYSWRSNRCQPHGQPRSDWNRLSGRVAGPLALPQPGSLEEFIAEHYWGYARGHDGRTREYRVLHPPWRVAPASDVVWDCDAAATYDGPFAAHLAVQPSNAFIADGSAVQLFRGRPIEGS